MSHGFQACHCEEVLHHLRRFSKTVQQLFHHILILFPVLDRRDPFVNIQLLVFIRNIFFRNVRIDLQVDRRLEVFLYFDSFCFLYGFIQHLTVEIVSYRFHVTVLFRSQKIARTTQFQITHGNLDPASQFSEFADRMEAFFCNFF